MARGSHATWSEGDSHATWSEGDQRVCFICGQPAHIDGRKAIWIHIDDETGEHRTCHDACGSPLEPGPTLTTTQGGHE